MQQNISRGSCTVMMVIYINDGKYKGLLLLPKLLGKKESSLEKHWWCFNVYLTPPELYSELNTIFSKSIVPKTFDCIECYSIFKKMSLLVYCIDKDIFLKVL